MLSYNTCILNTKKQIESKIMKKFCCENRKHKTFGIVKFISNKVNFKPKNLTRHKGRD